MLISGMEKDESLIPEFSNEDQTLFESPLNGKLQEIDIKEIILQEAIGKGSFGVVYKAIWRDFIVAVKKVETDTEVTAFQNEIKQLSRIQHDNIIHMYGVASSISSKCLVMEFADGGSLYDFLHCPPLLKYNISHALSWLLQCAKAIDYLHSYQPKPIIHRDLKPLNMLLTNGRKVLKVCDFGTACVLRSTMTDNRGSIAWMAPEVMKGQSYDQKCDVYSWGMILWEVLTRRIPFEEWGIPIRIIWQVINNKRPPPIQGCPKPLENLITSCWSQAHSSRPSMQHVVEVMIPLYRVLSGGDEPITYTYSSSGDSYTESFMSPGNDQSSGSHTSRDVSELPSTSNTVDLPYNQQSNLPSSTQSSSNPGHHTSNENTLDDSSDHMSKHSSAVSASSKLPVMNPNCPRLWREGTNFHPSSFTPFSEAKAKIGKKTWPPPQPAPSRVASACPSTASGAAQGPTAKEDASFFMPLSITIPNSEPLERKDIVIAPNCDHSQQVLDSLYNRGAPLKEKATSPVNSSQQVMPNDQYVASASRLDPSLSPLSVCPNAAQARDYSSQVHPSSPLSVQRGAISQLRHECALPSSINITSPTPHTSNDSIDLASSCLPGVSQTSDNLNASMQPKRRHLATNPLAPLRRRSAEVPESSSTFKITGHKRSSSYESSSMIGFEPLLNEVSQISPEMSSEMKHFAPCPTPISDEGRLAPEADPGRGSNSCLNYIPPTAPSSFTHVHPKTNAAPTSDPPPAPYPANQPEGGGVEVGKEDLGAFWELLDNELKPLMPLTNFPLSQQVFQQHKELAHQFLVSQENIVYLDQQKKDLLSQLSKQEKNHKSCQQRYNEKLIQLQNKNEGLRRDHLRLSQQLADIKRKRQASQHQHLETPQPPPQPQLQPQVPTHTHQHQQTIIPNIHPYQQHTHYYRHNLSQNQPLQQHHSSHPHHACCDPHLQPHPSHPPHQARPHLHPQNSSMYPNLQNQ